MFSVLIVDDEDPVLESYEFMLKNFHAREDSPGKYPPGGENRSGNEEDVPGSNPFVLAGKARSGYEALKLIYETEPDLVFMDINIPGLDGLSVLEDVYKKYPRMVCILSTAYERFDLAQRAIPLGVFAYLVKPVSKKTFFETLESALAELRSLPEEKATLENPLLRFLRTDIWKELSEETWRGYREELALPSDRGFTILLEIETDLEKRCALLAKELSFKHHCVYDIMLNRVLFLVSECPPRDLFLRRWEKITSAVFPANAVWRWGMGGVYRGPQLYRSCAEALAEMETRRATVDTGERDRLKIIKLRRKIGFVDPEEARALFREIWESAFAGISGEASPGTSSGAPPGTPGDFSAAKAAMVSLFTLLLDDITGAFTDPEIAPPFKPAEIMGLENTGAWKHWTELHFEKLLLLASEKRTGNFPPPLVKALGYIREHYAEGIQLGDAAESALVSAAYLSRLFTERLKTNFIDYLTDLRIGEAEKLLKNSSMTIKDIAYAVGYQDPNYFSRIFKRITGKLPTERQRES
ncbi:MAG: helix-turn-helix domain-containing protein [Treponema sp.]|jgi:two-component system response regulator YesN|nr:helix-turn-helix domain-containing protein [Treponema sp.]